MDLGASCSLCASILRLFPPPFSAAFPSNVVPWRRKTASELHASPATVSGCAPSMPSSHKVIVHDRKRGVTHEFFVPEDQYILHAAESQNISLPFACRHGCCTSCAVRVKSGEIRQPEALGISSELKAKGYALLCVGFPSSDIEIETQDEDEVYWLQFGRYFARGPVVNFKTLKTNLFSIFFLSDKMKRKRSYA